MGANTVETYVSWNLHEPRMGEFDFGEGGNDFSDFMNIRKFVEIAQEEDLLVIIRPGPYICAEWEFGGKMRNVFLFVSILVHILFFSMVVHVIRFP